jgi:hypothetical protein
MKTPRPTTANSVSLLLFLILLCATSTNAQSTIMSAPSTDVVPPKRVYVEMDFITDYAWKKEDSFQNYVPRAVVGVGKNVEVGVNVSFTHQRGVDNPIEFQPNAKWQFYNNEGKGIAGAVGCIWYVPATNRVGTDTFGQCYSVVSKQFSGTYGPRFTGGGYVLIQSREDQGSRAGAIAGYQQPFARNAGFAIDWFSGDNRFGFINPALYVNLPRNSSLSGGYAIANHGAGRNYLFAYYGMQF